MSGSTEATSASCCGRRKAFTRVATDYGRLPLGRSAVSAHRARATAEGLFRYQPARFTAWVCTSVPDLRWRSVGLR